MKSKTSFFNKTVFKKNLTRFAPVMAVYTLCLILGMMMERAKVALPPRTSTYDVVIIEYLKKAVPVEAASWEEAKMLVNEAWDNGTYVLTADDFAGVSFTLGR